jgi:hypothetical protein
LHGDDPELILLVHPHKEGLLVIVVDASALRPVTLHTGGNQVLVARHEEEVIIHQLLADLFLHAQERVVGASQVSPELAKGTLHEVLNSQALLPGDTRRETKALNGAAHTDAGGLDRGAGINVSPDLADLHVRGMLEVLLETMVLQDDGIKHSREDLIGVSITSVDTAVLVVKLDSASNGL